MNSKLPLFAITALALTAARSPADVLPHNFWVNPTFESGTNLDQPDGTVTGWNRGGGDPTICQVITNNSVSPTHALGVVDQNSSDSGFGEWYCDVTLGAGVNEGDTLDIQWYEMYNLSGPEMRLTVLFFNAVGAQAGGPTHFVTSGNTSPGWVSSLEDSTFTQRNESVVVPAGAVKMRCSLVSGGSGSVTGVMAIDDLSVQRAPVANLLYGNFWPNPSFELGDNLDQPTGTLSNWNRGGSSPGMCQVMTTNYTSSSHALAVMDLSPGDLYGEWYSDVLLAGNASPGDTLNLQWFEMYFISVPQMRVSVTFFNNSDTVVGTIDFPTSRTASTGWRGSIANSTFTRRNVSVVVPAGAARMRCSLISGGAGTVTGMMVIDDFSVARVVPVISGNFWVNSNFENGSGLDQTNGTPANWNRGGSDTSIDQVTTNNYTSSTHALALVDYNDSGYGEWYADVALSGHAKSGDRLDVQWSEAYGITNGEMRVTVGFLDAANALLAETHFTGSGNSPGWVGTIDGSPFVARLHEVVVPPGAATMRIALASGGALSTAGTIVIDDLSVALHPPTILTDNFFPNPTFENGNLLDNPTAASPAGIWTRGGSDSTIDQVSTLNSVTPSHSLALVDNNGSGYGEWYGFLDLGSLVHDGDVLDFQWYQLYNVSGNMRLSFAFLDAGNTTLMNHDFVVGGQSPGWTGSIAGSPFERQFQRLEVPAGTTQLRVNFASGGSSSVTGTMIIDDLSIRVGQLMITDASVNGTVVSITWDSSPTKTYTVLFASELGPNTTWTPLITGMPSGGLTTTYYDVAVHPGNAGFYRIVQE